MVFLVRLFKLSLPKATNMKRKAVFVSVCRYNLPVNRDTMDMLLKKGYVYSHQ